MISSAREDSGFRLTVVALLALSAVPRHMAEATARVAGSARASTVSTLSATGAPATTLLATCLSTVARDVTNLTALITLLTTSSAVAAAAVATLLTTSLWALARQVTSLTALVTRLLGLGLGALAAHMTLLTAVVAGRVALVGAVARLMSSVATWKVSVSPCNTIASAEVSRAAEQRGWFHERRSIYIPGCNDPS